MRNVLMLAALALMVSTTMAQVHTVTQSGLQFVDSISGTNVTTVPMGTTVEWVWSGGIHTVTSGTGALDPTSGMLFNFALDSANPTHQYTFTAPGTYSYYCIPHENFGMTGTVVVTGPTLAVSAPNPGGLSFDVTNFGSGDTFIVLLSLAISTPTGSGPLFGVHGSAWSQVLSPLVFGVCDATGTGSWAVPFGIPPGIAFDAVALDIAPPLIFAGATPAVTFVTQ
jgi:plastocyanin